MTKDSNEDIKDFIIAKKEIELVISKNEEESCEISTSAIITISTDEASLEEITANSHTLVYIFVQEEDQESCCFEFDPFSNLIEFVKEEKKGFKYSFKKRIPILEIEQLITISFTKREESSPLRTHLDILYELRQES